MRKHSKHGLRAVGYARVSTEGQAQEGVSLDAQQVKIRAHCLAQEIELIDLVVDEGVSAKTLDRPGLTRALKLLTSGAADAIVVVKLDRLTRSVKDLGQLCDSYFREGLPYSLVSVSDSIDTRSATGKLMLNVLVSVAQWEREAISERTKEALVELRRQGVKLGVAPYGWRYCATRDSQGRKPMEPDEHEQTVLRRITELAHARQTPGDIVRLLNAESVPCRGSRWGRRTLYRILEREGLWMVGGRRNIKPKAGKPATTRDRAVALEQALSLRAQGLSLRQIGDRLKDAKVLPARGDTWHAATISDLLRNSKQ